MDELEDRKKELCWYIEPCEGGDDPNNVDEATVLATDAAVSESLRAMAPLVLIRVGGTGNGSYIGLFGGYITLEAAIAERKYRR
jgi:hypothetical protein